MSVYAIFKYVTPDDFTLNWSNLKHLSQSQIHLINSKYSQMTKYHQMIAIAFSH